MKPSFAPCLFDEVAVLRAQRHDVAHVDLVEGRQHGGGLLRVLEPPRDRLTQPRHPHALFARGVVGGRRRADLHRGRRLRDPRRRRRGALDRGQHVALGDAAVPCRCRTRSSIDAGFRGDLRTDGAERRVEGGCRSRCRFEPRGVRGARLRCRCGAAFRGRRGAGAFLDLAEDGADGDGLAILGGDIAEHARGRSRHFDRLGRQQPVTSLQVFDPAAKHETLPQTLEQIAAAEYVKLIRRVHPTGPYVLAGWCVAGALAFEIARQLAAGGEQVSNVFLIDSWVPGYFARLPLLRRLIGTYTLRWQLARADWRRFRSGQQTFAQFIDQRGTVQHARSLLALLGRKNRVPATPKPAVA